MKTCTKTDIQWKRRRKQKERPTEGNGEVGNRKDAGEKDIGAYSFPLGEAYDSAISLFCFVFTDDLQVACMDYSIYSNIPQRFTNHTHRFCIMFMELATTICFGFFQNWKWNIYTYYKRVCWEKVGELQTSSVSVSALEKYVLVD